HLRMDAAALLVARALSPRRLCPRASANASRNARPALHPAADRALHARALRGVAHAVRHPDEWRAVSDCGHRARCRVRSSRREALSWLQRRPCSRDVPLLDSLSCRVILGLAPRPLLAVAWS